MDSNDQTQHNIQMNMNTNTRLLMSAAVVLATALSSRGQPVITQQPTNQMPNIDGSAVFSITATGSPPPTYQWRFNGTDLPNETANSLSLFNVQFPNAGPYSVVVSNDSGGVTSQTAWLSVLPNNVVNLGDIELSFGVPTNVTELNTSAYEDASSISADGLTLFFDSARPGGLGGLDIWSSTRSNAAAPWNIPVNLGPQINSTDDDGEPRISADGLSLYYGSTRAGGLGDVDIWVVSRSPLMSAWEGPPVNLGSSVNSAWGDGQPSLSADELILVFASDRPGGPGGFADLWITTRTNRGAAWNEPVNLVELNSGNTELYPTLSPDGLLLFFMSSRTSEPNGNVWVSKRSSRSSPFDPPMHVDSIAPTAQRAKPHALAYDGTTLYYSSFNRPGGLGDWDLWQISVTRLPQLKALGKNPTGEFGFELLGREGANYEIQVSPDFKAWTPWLTTNASGTVGLNDPASAPEGRRFYRVLSH